MQNDETQEVQPEQEIEQEAEETQETDWKAEALKYKAMLQRKTKKVETKEIIREETPLKPMDILRDEAFKLYREGYDEDEIDLIVRNGGRKILEDKNNALTLGLEAKREQRKAEQAASAASDSSGMTEVERKFTPEQLKNMSAAELEKVLPHA